MIRYVDTSGDIHEEMYYKDINSVNLSHKNITKILTVDGFSNLQVLYLEYNRIEEIKWLEGLSSLKKLFLSYNRIKEIKGLEGLSNLQILFVRDNKIKEIKGLEGLKNLQKLCLGNNQITEIKGLEGLSSLQDLSLGGNQIKEIKGLEGLSNLQELCLGRNQITEIKGLDGLSSLTELSLINNQIKEIKGLDGLISLKELVLSINNITEIKGLVGLNSLIKLRLDNNRRIKEIKGLEELSNLRSISLTDNKIKEIKGLEGLISLQSLSLYNTQIREVPFTVMNLRNLDHLSIHCNINPIIQRFLDRNRVKSNKTIYDDSQNVHDSQIVKSVKHSIYNIINESKNISIDVVLKEIVDDEILNKRTKSQLVEYCQDKTVHSLLNLTFDEVLCSVWNIIIEHKERNEIKAILNEEMKDSMCKCFTGRLSRLINCLNGFDERVSIQINNKEQILNVIISIRNKYDDVDKQKEEAIKELTERGFDKNIINEYIVYLE